MTSGRTIQSIPQGLLLLIDTCFLRFLRTTRSCCTMATGMQWSPTSTPLKTLSVWTCSKTTTCTYYSDLANPGSQTDSTRDSPRHSQGYYSWPSKEPLTWFHRANELKPTSSLQMCWMARPSTDLVIYRYCASITQMTILLTMCLRSGLDSSCWVNLTFSTYM